jgi:hypothetical protein
MIPAVLYGAKSTDDPKGSIPSQLADARAGAEGDGRLVVAEYSDENRSAYRGNRGRGLQSAKEHALALARDHGQAELWIQHSDRVARGDGVDADHLAEVWFALRRGRVRMRSVQDDSNLEDAIRVVLIGERNFEDSKRKGAAVSSGMRRRKQRGLHVGGAPDYGYELVRDEFGRTAPVPLRINPAEARVVRRIHGQVALGLSQKLIAQGLNDDGILTRQGRTWWPASIGHIVRNPFQAGYLRGDDSELIRGQHDPIVTLEQWERTQAISKARNKYDGKGGRSSKTPALFTNGHLRCGRCGAPMGIRRKSRFSKNGQKRYYWDRYCCTGRERTALRGCDMPPIPPDAVEAVILDELKAQPGQLAARIKGTIEVMLSDRQVTADRLAEAEREAATLTERQTRVQRDYLGGDLSAKHHAEFVAVLDEQQAANAAQVAQLRARLDELDAAVDRGDLDQAVGRVMDRARDVLNDSQGIEHTRAVIRSIWPQIVVHHDGGQVRLETGEVSDGLAAALCSTTGYDGLPGGSSHSPES